MNIKKKAAIIAIFVFVVLSPNFYAAGVKGDEYKYDVFGNEISASPIFSEKDKINKNTTGYAFESIVDVETYGNNIYVVDSGKNEIAIFDSNYNLKSTISDGGGKKFNKPNGVAVNGDNILVADTGNKRIVAFDTDTLEFKHEFGKPTAPGLENKEFTPTKVQISEFNDVYIIATGVYEGIISTDINGKFIQFVGVNEVELSVSDLFWRSFATEEQLSQMTRFLPTEFSSISVDQDGFIYTTTSSNPEEPIKKLNSNGEDVLNVYEDYETPKGDIMLDLTKGSTQLVAIDVTDQGNYAVIDQTTRRIFIYDQNGYMVGIYGNQGTTKDKFNVPVDLKWLDNNTLLVADKLNKEIVVLEATEFLENIFVATEGYYNNDMEASLAAWTKVLSYNANYDLASLGIGKVHYRLGDFDKALEYFSVSGNRELYSLAFDEKRNEFIEKYFLIIAVVFFGFLILLYRSLSDKPKNDDEIKHKNNFIKILHNAKEQYISTPFSVMFRPFRSFEEMKTEGRGSYLVALSFIVIYSVIKVIEYNATGFIVNENNIQAFNGFIEFMGLFLPLILLISSNWSISTLTNGKGSFKEITMIVGYSIFPLIIASVIALIFSNVMIMPEAYIYSLILVIGFVFTAFNLLVGLIVMHDFTLGEAVKSILLSVVSFMIQIFVLLLLYSLLLQLIGFISVIGTEILQRLGGMI